MTNAEDFLQGIYDTTDQSNCSGFLKDVARKLGILGTSVPDDRADGIIDFIARSPQLWVEIGRGASDGQKAELAATQGYLVVALLKAKDHVSYPHHSGHVAVVLPTTLKGAYPFIICAGSSAGQSKGNKAVLGVWTRQDAPLVHYYRTTVIFDALKGTK